MTKRRTKLDDDIEDELEAAFWRFDTRRKKHGESERDAFKAELRRAMKAIGKLEGAANISALERAGFKFKHKTKDEPPDEVG